MRIAVMGAGEFGSQFGYALLKAGQDVTLIARGRRYDEIARDGVRGKWEANVIPPDAFTVTRDPAAVGPVDAVIFAVKTYQLEEAAEQIAPLIGEDTVVIPLQNGVTAGERLAGIVERRHVLEYATSTPHAIGELGGPVTPRVEAMRSVLASAGFDVAAADDIRVPLWQKLVQYAALSTGLAARADLGQTATSPELRKLVREGAEEAAKVAAAEGIPIEPGAGESVLAFLDEQKGSPWRSSMLKDLEAGRPLELEDLIGHVVNRGGERGIPTPVLRVCYLMLKPFAQGALPPGGRR